MISPEPLLTTSRETTSDLPTSSSSSSSQTTTTPTLRPEHFVSERVFERFHKLQRRIPLVKKVTDKLSELPVRVRLALFGLWVVWKVFFSVFLIFFVVSSSSSPEAASSSSSMSSSALSTGNATKPIKLLYIVTSLAEYNSGRRQTVKGQDRLAEVMMPVLVDSVKSLRARPFHYEVDVFLILAFELRPERLQFIRDQLPNKVGLEIWDDACPSGYDVKGKLGPDKLLDNTRALSRQHRYVIKDKIDYYDLFLAFEDDMRITGDHVSHFLTMSHQIDQLRREAPSTLPADLVPESLDPYSTRFFGPMTKGQLDRVVPGFIRVEVLLNESDHGAQTTLDPIPLDYTFPINDENDGSSTTTENNGIKTTEERHFNPRICCYVNMEPNMETPEHPAISDVIIWETNIKAFAARKMPPIQKKQRLLSSSSSLLLDQNNPNNSIDWVGILPGPGKKQSAETKIGGFWSGRHHEFGDEEKPSGGRPDIIGQQGGWMLTKSQILRLNSGLCMGSFLPPFEKPSYNADGQESKNVEYWSGGYQLFTGVAGGCNMQRIMSLHPDHFSKHFIYHVANNKQKQLNRERMLRADHFLGQINTVKKLAEKEMMAATSSKQ